MTDTLYNGNGNWTQEKKFDKSFVERINSKATNIASLSQSEMERGDCISASENHRYVASNGDQIVVETTNSIANDEQETNYLIEDDRELINEFEEDDDDDGDNDDDDDDEVDAIESDCEAQTNNDSKVPYMYTGHLGTTSPSVLRHIDEAIDQVVKHFQVNKSDLMLNHHNHHTSSSSLSLLASPKNSSSPIANKTSSSQRNNNSSSSCSKLVISKSVNSTPKTTSTTVKSKKKKKKSVKNKNKHPAFSFDHDEPFELNSSSNKRKKAESNKKKDALIGPFIRVEHKKTQTNYVVVNSSSKLEDNKQMNKINYGSIAKSKSSNSVLFKPNDNTWICVFCKRQPHYRQMGDLFGPHEIVITDQLIDSSNLNSSRNSGDHQNDDDALPSTSDHTAVLNNKSALKKEVWFHEDCIIWSNGIYLAANRIRNLDEVVLECGEISCVGCKLKGANLGCVHKGCNQTFHFACAREKGCELDQETFSMFCSDHKLTSKI